MLLSGIRPKPLILGLIVFAMSAHAQAAHSPASKAQADSKPEPLFSPVAEGSRLYNGNLKDEFYILSQDQEDPPRPMIVNAKPLEAGLDEEALLVKDAETIMDANNLVHEMPDEEVPETGQSFIQASMPLAEPPYFAESTPPEIEIKKINADSEYAREQVARESTLSKVKGLLKKLTRKIADRKQHATQKTRMAEAGKARSKLAVMRVRFVD